MNKSKILQVNNLRTYFFIDAESEKQKWQKTDIEKLSGLLIKNKKLINRQIIKAVDDVSFDIYDNEIVGIVGESGSGKTVTAFSILKLIPDPPGKIISGDIIYNNQNLFKVSDKEFQNIRGKEISMIFQEPMTSLNPVLKIGDQITEGMLHHFKITKKEANENATTLLNHVGISDANKRMREYPHQFSGGMRQRVMIAIALSCNPKLLIADEPTTALDVTIQSQILNLLIKTKEERNNFSILLITHNLSIVAEICDRVFVMYGGKIQESTDVKTLFSNPLHPYTQGLLKSIPNPLNQNVDKKLFSIKGIIPPIYQLPIGCKFATRCDKVMDHCYVNEPPIVEVEKDHNVRCHLYSKNEK